MKKSIFTAFLSFVLAFALGAQAIQMGSRFVMSEECIAHPNYKNAVLKAKDRSTVVTGRSLGHPARVLHNKLSRKYEEMEAAGVISPVVSVSAKYHKMSRFPETLRIAVEIADYNGARMRLCYWVTEKTSGELRCTGESEHCYLDAEHKLISLKRSKPEIHAILDTMK